MDRPTIPALTRKSALALGGAAMFWTALPRAARAQVATIQFGSVGGLTDAGIYLAEELGYFTVAGIAVTSQIVPGAPPLVAALAANQLDVAGISVTPGLFAAVDRGIALRIVGDKQSYHNGFSATRLIARPSVVKATLGATIQNWRGKSLAVSAKAGATYFLLVKALEKFGLTVADVKIVELAYPNMGPALSTGAIDAAVSIEPFLSQTLRSGDAKMVSDLVEFAPGGSMVIVPLVFSEGFIKNRPVSLAFMKAYVQGVRAYIDAVAKNKNKDKVMEIIARRSKLDEALVRASFPCWLDPDQRVNTRALDVLQTFFVQQGMLAAPIDLNRLVDPSFAQAAVAALGAYR